MLGQRANLRPYREELIRGARSPLPGALVRLCVIACQVVSVSTRVTHQ